MQILPHKKIKCNINDKSDMQSLYFKAIANWKKELLYCDKCDKNHNNYKVKDYYKRYVYNHFIDEVQQIKVLRIKCADCGSTHALLAHFMIPHKKVTLYVIEIFIEIFIINPDTKSARAKCAECFSKFCDAISNSLFKAILLFSKLHPLILKFNLPVDYFFWYFHKLQDDENIEFSCSFLSPKKKNRVFFPNPIN